MKKRSILLPAIAVALIVQAPSALAAEREDHEPSFSGCFSGIGETLKEGGATVPAAVQRVLPPKLQTLNAGALADPAAQKLANTAIDCTTPMPE